MSLQSVRFFFNFCDEAHTHTNKPGFGKLGKHGDLGYETRRIRLNDISFRHGISMHPPNQGRAFATYKNIKTHYKRFRAIVGINDNNNFFEIAGGPVTFRLEIRMENGTKINAYESRPVRKARDLQIVDVNLPEHMSTLTLVTEALQSNSCAHAVWANAVIVPEGKPCTNTSWKSAVRSGLRIGGGGKSSSKVKKKSLYHS
ncbi:NPCBM/NEW2 domain-containing protein [bacterium]|nr:NPCBM/NEW2 domain-containing protein [bacterium]